MVHLLPHERFDLYKKAVNKLFTMEECLLDLNNCINNDGSPCQEKIKCPNINQDKDNMHSKNEVDKKENPLDPKQVNSDIQQYNSNHSNNNIFKLNKNKTSTTATDKKVKQKSEPKCLWNKNHSNKISLKNESTILVIDN